MSRFSPSQQGLLYAMQGMAVLMLVMPLALPACVIGCDSADSTTANRPGYGEFQAVAPGLNADDIPFEFVFPTYLPQGVDTRPDLTRILPDSRFDHTADVTIRYHAVSGAPNPTIHLSETNVPHMLLPNGPEYTYFKLADVNIVQEGGWDAVPDIAFFWMHDGIHFYLRALGVEHSECLMVIESIIKQTQ